MAKSSVSKRKMSPEAVRQYHAELRIQARVNRRIRNIKAHGDYHNRVDKHLAEVLEKTFNSSKGWYMPKLVGGTKTKYGAIKDQRVFYIREGEGVALYKTTGEMGDITPQHHPGNPIREYLKVNDVWVRTK